MVVCKCRKATKLYCFVHKVPVCGECICFQEHQICVIKTYSEWVIDGDYDWPPKCSSCNETLQEGADPVIRLGCLHVLHSSCLVSYLQNFPPNTTPVGYACPLCSDSIWPPKSIRDPNSAFSSRLKDIITQSGLSKQLLGSDATASLRQSTLPPVTSSDLSAFLASSSVSASLGVNNGSTPSETGLSILGTSNLGNPSSNGANESATSSSQIAVNIDSYTSNSDEAFTPFLKANPLVTPGAMTRIKPSRGGKLGANEDDEDDDDDDDGASRKYNRRGPFHKKFLRFLIPFWSTSLPTLPVTATQRKDERERDPSVTEELIEGRPRRRQRSSSSSFDPTKVLLLFAVLSCIATALLLYYRLAQGSDKQGLQQIEEQ